MKRVSEDEVRVRADGSMDPKVLHRLREEFRDLVVRMSAGCEAQQGLGTGEKGWPCGTCFHSVLGHLGVVEDGEHNEPVHRGNEFWRAFLQMRDVDYNATGGKEVTS